LNTNKKIILVNLPQGNDYRHEDAGKSYPAPGIMVIGTILKKKGYDVSLIDGALYRDYEEKVLEKVSGDTAFIGFSAMTSQIVMAHDLAERVKAKCPGVPVIFGGVHATLYPEQTVQNSCVDIAVINEGSKTVLEIMDYIAGRKHLGDINGIAFCDKNGEVKVTPPRDLDDILDIPHFDFKLLDIERYLSAKSVYKRELDPEDTEELRVMPILTGLGCCFRCAFCINVILGRKYRLRSAESVVNEMKRLQSEYGANGFLFLDEDFCINRKRLAEFIDLVKEKGIDFSGRIWTRVSYFRQEAFRKTMRELEGIGIRSIAMGAESGSQKILDYIKKDIKLDDITFAAKELSGGKITPRFSFITGMEGEKKEDTIATYKLCRDLLAANPRVDIAGPFIFRYYPGSPIFAEMVEKYNIHIPQSIDEWRKALNDDGSLSIDSQQWTWPGFSRYSESMHDYITTYAYVLNKPFYREKTLFKILKKMILWRISCGEHLYVLDYYFFKILKKMRSLFKNLRHMTRARKEKIDENDRNNSVKVEVNAAS